jgi:ABC-2 type transport system permease protein
VLLGVLYGAIAAEAESMLSENPELADFLAGLGGASITDAFLATSMLVVALAAAGATVAVVGRLRTEETAGRAELLLSAPVSRRRWLFSHLGTAGIAMLSVLVLGGAATGLAAAVSLDEPVRVPQLVGAALLFAPATAVLASAAVLVFAVAPRWTVLGWSGVAIVGVVGLFGQVLDLPQWMRDVSPFEHVPAVPAADVTWLPMVVMAAVAAGVLALAVDRLSARDIPHG